MRTPRNWFDLMPLTIFDNATCGQRKTIEQWIGRIQQDAIINCAVKPNLNGINKKVKKLIGRNVYINWNFDFAWHTFKVKSVGGKSVELEYIESLDGASNQGNCCVFLRDIESIREIGPK